MTTVQYYSEYECFNQTILCIVLASIYVGSLYLWRNNYGRNHPETIKRRSISVFGTSILSAVIVYLAIDRSYFGKEADYLSLIGFRLDGLIQAVIYPLLITLVLFCGPIFMNYTDGEYENFFDLGQWRACLTNAMWLRNHVIAPFFEEFTFRACMLPILVPCFGSEKSVILCPLFFGVAHLHLLSERLADGVPIRVALLQSLFQLIYTTIFGAYSTYLFLRTGHFFSPLIIHALCNHMGFPNFGQVLSYRNPKKYFLIFCFVAGLCMWLILLKPLTEPDLYFNDLYW